MKKTKIIVVVENGKCVRVLSDVAPSVLDIDVYDMDDLMHSDALLAKLGMKELDEEGEPLHVVYEL